MEQQQQREWCELRSRTWRLLRQREHILRSKHRPLLQYLVMPSFTDTWCIDVVRSSDALAVYHTAWRTTHDIEAFATAIERLKHPRPFVPTLESTPLHVAVDTVESWMSSLARITLPLKPIQNSISLDGTLFEFHIGDGWTGTLLRWHNCFPDEWPPELRDILSGLDAMEYRLAGHASEPSDARETSAQSVLNSNFTPRSP